MLSAYKTYDKTCILKYLSSIFSVKLDHYLGSNGRKVFVEVFYAGEDC